MLYGIICEYPIAFLKGNRTLADFGIRNGSSIIFRGIVKMDNFGWSIALVPGTPLIIGDTPDVLICADFAGGLWKGKQE